MDKVKRPISVVILSCIIFVVGFTNLLRLFSAPSLYIQIIREILEEYPIGGVAVILKVLATFVLAISGVGIFFGCNWARWLFIIWIAAHIIVLWLIYPYVKPAYLVAGLGVWALFTYILLRHSLFFYSRSLKKKL